ncbi:prolyl-tRNA synthetase associated domain-containing protein [Arenibaculum sp.]|jgi:Ala-tRNA(Pro) deacylase|uniref:prolyl-tRNA synthetase associated domain-containing protein n=1 Tax=Arenibaculum sp. TaxID=2865862 RepID=UPI002E0EAED1|nr:prolyl-tRNA synthetase associated domain-containing protein [Arenibaculum sp.]
MTDTLETQPLDRAPATPEDLFAFLDAHGIRTTTVSHPPLFTVEDSKALRGELPGGHCKNLFLKDKKNRLWLVVALEDTAVDLKTLDRRIGSARLSFGRPELLWETLGVRPGAVTPFSVLNDREHLVTVVLERAMTAHELLNYHPLINDRTTAIRSADLLRFLRATGHEPEIVDLGPPSGS